MNQGVLNDMATELDRIYIRFKGRVLGPLTHEKASELVKRGQITRQHELSPDGNEWQSASEFKDLFPDKAGSRLGVKNDDSYKIQSDTVAPELLKPTAGALQWYAHFDGANQGPADDLSVKNWVAIGKVTQDTLVWRQGMENWIAAGVLKSEWFGNSKGIFGNSSKSSKNPQSSIETGESSYTLLIEHFIVSQRWVAFLAITGIVLGTAWIISSIAGFFFVATRTGIGPPKVSAVVFSVLLVASSIAWFLASVFLLQHSNRVAVLRYRCETEDLKLAIQTLSRFWKFTGITVLCWIVIFSIFASMLYLLGLSVPF